MRVWGGGRVRREWLRSGTQKPRMVIGIEILSKISSTKYKVLQKQNLLPPWNISEWKASPGGHTTHILLVIFLSKTQSLEGNSVGVFPEEMSISISSLSRKDSSPQCLVQLRTKPGRKRTEKLDLGHSSSIFKCQNSRFSSLEIRT